MKHARTLSFADAGRNIAAALAALHLLLFAAFALSLVSAAEALSAVNTCQGENLMTRLEAERPDEFAAVRAEAGGIPNGRGVLWEVVSPAGAVSHVFGTMHSPDPRVAGLKPEAEAAFANSRLVAVESTDALDREKMTAQMSALRSFAFLDGQTLDDLLPADVVSVVKAEADVRGLPWLVARQMQPWMIAAAIARARCDADAEAQGAIVLDAVLAERAAEAGKQLVGLETVAEQFEAVAGIPQAFHINALADLAAMAGSTEDMMETTKQLYLQGETGLMLPLMRLLSPKAYEGEGYADFQRRLISQRNRNMVDRALPELEKGGVFMAVGALHLPGAEGVLGLLAQRGYLLRLLGG